MIAQFQLFTVLCMLLRFCISRRVLDSEMKEGTRQAIAIARKEEKLSVSEEDENKKFLVYGVIRKEFSLVECVHYNWKLLGSILRSSEH